MHRAKLSVLQWNVWYKESNQRVAEFLQEQNADIICLQELTIEEGEHGNAPEYLAQRLGYRLHYKEIDLGEGKVNLANAILSRYPIVDATSTWINVPTGTGGYDDEYRALVEVAVKVGAKELRVATTHMSYMHRFEITPRKSRETDLLVKAIAGHTENFILTGDLNALPGSYTITSIERHLNNAGPDHQVPTWTTKPFSYNGFTETELRWRLDYVFATKELRVVSSRVLATDCSDHLPILTVFEL